MRALPLLLGAMACSATAPTRTPPAQPIAKQSPPRPCPLELDGASVAVTETPLGVALEFTSYADVAELRRQVRMLGHGHILEDVEGGARIVFAADLRSQVEAAARDMEAGACPITMPSADDRVVTTR